MASAEELLRDAQHAFQNITPGSADEKKYTARAKKLAHRIVRKYPASIEAEQARAVLRSLGEMLAISKSVDRAHSRHSHQASWETPHKNHSQNDEPTRQDVVNKLAAVTEAFRLQREGDASSDEASWQDIWQKFADLSYFKKKIVVFVMFFVFVIFGNLPFLLFAFVFYVFRPKLIRRHIYNVLSAIA